MDIFEKCIAWRDAKEAQEKGIYPYFGGISALVGKGEHIFTYKLNHASIMDGIFLSTRMRGGVRVHRFAHNDPDNLEKRLAAVPPDSTLIRTSYMAIHTDDELDEILNVAGREGKRLGII